MCQDIKKEWCWADLVGGYRYGDLVEEGKEMSKIQKIVRSESAKSCAKNSSREGLRRSVTVALLAALVAAPVAFGVYAADSTPYISVKTENQTEGSNYDSDGAKAADSMVIGIGSSSEAENSTVVGNNNTLKRYNYDRTGRASHNNIVAGQNLDVEGAYNAVFGTDYQNNREYRKTMAAGKYNTVIGVGNLAGYTAEKDPQDPTKWIYNKVQRGSDSGNVVVGLNNTATRGSLVIGADSEAGSLGTSVGHDNKIIGDSDYGVALGSHLIVDGEKAVAIGSDSKATADYATAIGQGATAEKESSIAFGDGARAKTRGGIAIGSSSLADRNKGVYGYNPLTKTSYDDENIKAMYDPSEVKELEAYTETIAQKTQERDEADRLYNQLFDQYEDMLDGKGDTPNTPENKVKLEQKIDEAQHALRNAKKELAAAQKQRSKITAPYQSTAAAVAVGDEKDGITRQITGVAAGTENTDAVNVAQLKALESTVNDGVTGLDTRITTNTEKITENSTKIIANTEKITELGGRIGILGNRVDRVGAGAAALAALHPLDYDPENKWDFAAGYGNYSGANAVAIGAFYRPNENQMFSISGSFGGGENMVNAGISVKVGEGTGISTSKVAMANEIKNLKIANEKVQQENKEMKNEIEILKEQMQKLMAAK